MMRRDLAVLAALCGLLLLVFSATSLLKSQKARAEDVLESGDIVSAPSASLLGSSRFEDSRGSYERRCFGKAPEVCVNILFTRKGFLRSGDLHADRQVNHIITGAVKLTQRVGNRDVSSTHYKLETVVLPAYTPHLYEFLEDTLMTEYWIDAKGDLAPFKAWLFTPYRDLISNRSLVRLHESSAAGIDASAQPHDRSRSPA